MTCKFTAMDPLMRSIQFLLLATLLSAVAPQAHAQMTGNYSSDMAIVNGALAATLAATDKADSKTSRLTMEELYRQWRMFRAKNFADPANDPLFVPDMKKVEDALFEASKLIDNKKLAEAHETLQHAQLMLRAANKRQPGA